jgi:hypothetical protein
MAESASGWPAFFVIGLFVKQCWALICDNTYCIYFLFKYMIVYYYMTEKRPNTMMGRSNTK